MNTFERVRSVVAQRLDISEEQITPQACLKDDLAADSLDIVEIIMALEEEFEVEIGDDAGAVTTIQEIVDYLQAKLAVAA